MSGFPDLSFDPNSFGGVTRVFPLPNLVMFPHVIQPLHLFEPRYLALMEEALASDKLMTLAVLSPGWEQQYEGRPGVQSTACLCRVVSHQRLPDGRFNLLACGLQRVKLETELPPTKLFREFQASLLADGNDGFPDSAKCEYQEQLLSVFKRTLTTAPEVQAGLEALLGAQLALGALTDIVAHTLKLPFEVKLQLLEQANVIERARTILHACGQPARRVYPIQFSCN